jgi:hypothetical protein
MVGGDGEVASEVAGPCGHVGEPPASEHLGRHAVVPLPRAQDLRSWWASGHRLTITT